jgi:GNAT superfamily N-acetyltransferase
MPSLTLTNPTTETELDQVRDLMSSFLNWHLSRHLDDHELIHSYFDQAAFDKELRTLPGKYAAPDGALLLALVDGAPAGCVALRRIDLSSCEMKRMFVYERFHGMGVGKALGLAILEEARKLGFTTMKLDTSFRQTEALKLYEHLGFRVVEPYYDMPQELKDWLVFMEIDLR